MSLNIIVPLGITGSGKSTVSNHLCNVWGATEYHPLRPLKEIIEQGYGLEPYALETQEGKQLRPEWVDSGISYNWLLYRLLKETYPELADTEILKTYRLRFSDPCMGFRTFGEYLIHSFEVTERLQWALHENGVSNPAWITARWLQDYLAKAQGTIVLPGVRHPEEVSTIIDSVFDKAANLIILETCKRGKAVASDKHLCEIRDIFWDAKEVVETERAYNDIGTLRYEIIDNDEDIQTLNARVDNAVHLN